MSLVAFVPSLLVVVPQTVPQTDHSERLSAPLTELLASGEVEALDVSPDGSWALYRAPQAGGTPGLYATPTDGSAPAVLVSDPGASVAAFAINATGTRAVFRAGPELFRIGTSGNVVRLHPPLPANASVLAFALSPDGSRALYLADQEVAGRIDLYSVNLGGPPVSVRLSRATLASGDVFGMWVAPGSQRAIFVGNLVQAGRVELFSAPLDGSQADVALSGTLVAGGSVSAIAVAPSADGTRALYLADALVDGKDELFSVLLDGSAPPVQLSGPLPAAGDVSLFQVAPAGGRVAFTADALVDGRPELFSAPVDGSAAAVQVNGAATPVPSLFAFTPTGQTLVFSHLFSGGLSNQLWSVPADGSAAPLQLSNHPVGSRQISGVTITPDSLAAFYLLSYGGTRQLLRVPVDGSAAPLAIVPPLGTQVVSYRLTPDGLSLVLVVELVPTSVRQLSLAPADGSAPAVALHATAPLQVGPQDDLELVGGHVFFRGDLRFPGVRELFGLPLAPGQPPLRLSGNLPLVSVVTDVLDFELSSDGSRLGYTTCVGAYTLELGTGQTRTLMRSFASPFGGFGEVVFTPDDDRLFWIGPDGQLFSAPFDATAPTVQVHVSFAGVQVHAPRFSPDGTRYTFSTSTYFGPGALNLGPTDLSAPPAFLSSQLVQGLTYVGPEVVYAFTQYNPYYPQPTRLYRRPVDLSGPAVELVPTPGHFPPPFGRLAATPDGTRVLFVRDEQTPTKPELYSLSLAPGAQPLRLDDALGADCGVLRMFYPTPDSTRVLYVADRDTNEVFELYVVPVDGSQPPLELSGTLVSGGDVTNLSTISDPSVWITPGSTRAVYVADALADNRFDLYSVPLDGSAPPTLLVQGQGSFGSSVFTEPGAVQFSPDGSRVYVRGAIVTSNLFSLVSVPVAGGPLVHLGSTPITSADVSLPYFVLADGRVVYRMDLEDDERFELWIAPGDRPGRSHRRSFLGVPGGDVEEEFTVDAAGDWVYYRADARVNGETELFRYPLDPAPLVRER